MAQNTLHSSAATLRAITYRISSTPVEQLPQISPQIAGSLWSCKALLSTNADQLKQLGEVSVIVHKFKTHLSTLLQDRTVEGRWAAVVLVKATIEAGGAEVLSKSNAWVRNLLGILKKPDPATTRNLAVIALTRIFMLTWEHTNLVREITTPALPAFISTCVNNADPRRCSSSELSTILEAFVTLLPRHHTVFRTNESQIRTLLTTILSSTSSDCESTVHFTKSHRDLARRLLVLLHHCSPKQGAAHKWDETLKLTVAAIHGTCDQVFRSVIEDWQSTTNVQPIAPPQVLYEGEAEQENADAVGLTGWSGVFSGSERVITLLGLLRAHLETTTAAPVTLRLGLITDMLTRILSIAAPRPGKPDLLKANSQISKDERDAMYTILPKIHIATLGFIKVMIDRYDLLLISIVPTLLAQIMWVFQTEMTDPGLRKATYEVLKAILQLQGSSMAKEDINEIEKPIKCCCEDLLATSDEKTTTNSKSTAGLPISKPVKDHDAVSPGLQNAAQTLLAALCKQLNPANVPARARTQMERTAMLTENLDALVACVMNPISASGGRGKGQPSLLPLLARRFPRATEVDAFLRHRMPAIRQKASADDDEDEEEEEEEAQEEVDEDETMVGADEEQAPTNGLVDAFNQQNAAAATEKRSAPAPEVQEDTRPEKRLRASPLRRSSVVAVSQVANAPTAADPPPSSGNNTFVTAASQEAPVLPTSSAQTTSANTVVSNQVQEDEDDSDFEIPALTMDSDSDEE